MPFSATTVLYPPTVNPLPHVGGGATHEVLLTHVSPPVHAAHDPHTQALLVHVLPLVHAGVQVLPPPPDGTVGVSILFVRKTGTATIVIGTGAPTGV